MKKLLNVAAMVATIGFFSLCFAAAPTHVSGYVSTAMCAQHKSMHGAAHLQCAESCFKHGSPAVLVERNGKVLKIANQDAVKDAVGHNARLTGTVANGEITVTEVHVMKARARHHKMSR